MPKQATTTINVPWTPELDRLADEAVAQEVAESTRIVPTDRPAPFPVDSRR